MKKRVCTILILMMLLLLSLIFSFGSAAAAETDAFEAADLEAYLDGIISAQMDENHIPGVILSVVKDGEIVLLKGYGFANLEAQIAADPRQSLFRIGSTSKLFTWTAVMQMVETGSLDLDADINTYLDFEIPAELYGSQNDIAPGPITMKHLMSHTPGFEDVGEGLFVLEQGKLVTLEEFLKARIPARVYEPGKIMAYSNYGVALAGYIVERVSGIPFAEYIEKNIYAPLEMKNSTFRQPLPEPLAPYMAEGYSYHNGRYYRGSFEYIAALPAGSMSSTAEDMARFMIAHLAGGRYGDRQILQAHTTRLMHSQLFTAHPSQMGIAHGFIETAHNGYRTIEHGGNTLLFNTGLYLVPDLDLGLFVSYNGGLGTERANLFQLMMDRYYPETPGPEPKPIEETLEARKRLVGEYLPTRMNFTTLEKLLGLLQAARVGLSDDGYLLVNAFGMVMQFAEVEPGVFHNRDTSGTRFAKVIIFDEEEDGQILMIPEGPMPYYKVPWYGTITIAGLVLGGALLLLLSAAVGWLVASLGRLFKGKAFKAPVLALAARLTAILCGLLALVFIVGLMGIFSDINPAFGVPQIFFGETEGLDALLSLPLLVIISCGLMLLFSLLAWVKKYWTICGRLHYSLITISVLGLCWLFFYYRLL